MEIWKDIPGFDGYQASDIGRIKSKNRKVQNSKYGLQTIKERILKTRINKCGYIDIKLNGKVYTIHYLIMITFFGKSDLHIDHINGIKTDNRLENLEYVSKRENIIRYHSNKKDLPIGVRKKSKTSYSSAIYYKDELILLGSFPNIEEASKAYQLAILLVNKSSSKEQIISECRKITLKKSGLPYGVTKNRNKFRANLVINKKKLDFGSYHTIEEAENVILEKIKIYKNA